MTDEEKGSENANDGGQQSEQSLGDGEKTFTQQELDRVIGERLARQAASKYGDYDDLKAKAAQLQKIEDEQKTELQRAQEAKESAEKTAQTVMDFANQRLIQAEFLAQAALAGVTHPEDAYALADKTAVTFGEGGTVTGVSDAVKTLLDAGRLPMSDTRKAPKLDGGAGGGDRDGKLKLTPEQEAVAKRMGIPLEEYAKYVSE